MKFVAGLASELLSNFSAAFLINYLMVNKVCPGIDLIIKASG